MKAIHYMLFITLTALRGIATRSFGKIQVYNLGDRAFSAVALRLGMPCQQTFYV